MDDDDDLPQLSTEAMAALQEFYSEQLVKDNVNDESDRLNKCRPFKEDWQLSQFWYDDSTIEAIVNVASKLLKPGQSVCLISSPTLYYPMKKSLGDEITVHLLEYDTRFSAYGSDFFKYDFNEPFNLPEGSEHKYDLVIADPPFLSEECLTKTAQSIKFLSKDKMILCTGKTMADLARELLYLSLCVFTPRHEKNLANEFACYSNFDFDSFLG